MWADGHSHTDMSSMRQGILVLKPTCLRGSETSQAAWEPLDSSALVHSWASLVTGEETGFLLWRGILFQVEPGSPGPAF